ncbi:MAG: trypsin-like serine peptidase [Burkholderiales bacterium]|jgi:hypothetical protein
MNLPSALRLLLLVLSLAPPLAIANVFGVDRREQAAADSDPLRWVGQLHSDSEQFQTGSAVLVGECHILSAYHSTFFRRDGGLHKPSGRVVSRFMLDPDPQKPGTFRRSTLARPVAWGEFSRWSLRGQSEDWALLRLDDCLGREVGYADIAGAGEKALHGYGELLFAGYPQSRRPLGGVTFERGCHAWDFGPVFPIIGVDCAFERGASGGPLFELIERRWTVVGIASYRANPVEQPLPAYISKHRNVMVSSDAFSARVGQSLLAAQRLQPPEAVAGSLAPSLAGAPTQD